MNHWNHLAFFILIDISCIHNYTQIEMIFQAVTLNNSYSLFLYIVTKNFICLIFLIGLLCANKWCVAFVQRTIKTQAF